MNKIASCMEKYNSNEYVIVTITFKGYLNVINLITIYHEMWIACPYYDNLYGQYLQLFFFLLDFAQDLIWML